MEAFTASAMGMLIGCLAKDGDAALAMGPPIMTIFILFSGEETALGTARFVFFRNFFIYFYFIYVSYVPAKIKTLCT